MAYGLLLYKEIATPLGNQRLEIYKDGFSGTAKEMAGLHKDGITISKDSQALTQAITTSVLTISLSDCGEVDYSQFFTPNSTLFKVVWKTGTTTRWTGFITPDSFTENLAYRDTLTLTARDNLGRLNDYDFDLARGQMLSVRSILMQALAKAGVAMGLTVTTTKVAGSPATTLAIDGLVNTTLLQGMTWHEAVELLLTGLGMTLAWNDGNAFDLRDISQAPANSQSAFFINKSGYRQIRPAWKNLTIEQDYGLRDNFYEGQFTKADCGDGLTFTPPVTSRWAVTGGLTLLNAYKGAPTPSETLYIPVEGGDAMTKNMKYSFIVPYLQRSMKIAMKCNNSVWVWRDPADYYGYTGLDCFGSLITHTKGSSYVSERVFLRYRFNLFITVGATKYVMREGWEVYDPSTIAEPYLYFVMPASLNEYGEYIALDSDTEISFYVNNVPGAGTMELEIYPVSAQSKEDGDPTPLAMPFPQEDPNYHRVGYGRITNITMYIDEGIGGRVKNIDINSSHNVKGRAQASVGQVPEGMGNTLLYTGGLFYSDTYNTPLSSFARAAGGTNYDLLELVGREYLSYQNAAYNALSGTMMANAAFRFDKAISFDNQSYRIVGASLAVLSNTLQAQMLQQEAAFDVSNYDITTVDEEGGGSSSGGGGGYSPQGGGGSSDRFFTAILDEETGDTEGAKALYDLHIIQEEAEPGSGSGSGTPEVTKNITEILRHLSLRVVNPGTASAKTILVSDITFASTKNLISGGIDGGGDTPAGGSIATLVDVTLANLAGGDTLVYNQTSNHWENKPLLLANLGDVDGTPSNGQTLIYDATTGKWKPGNAGGGGGGTLSSVGLSMPTGFTVANSPLTANGTLTVTFASGYGLVTDTERGNFHTHSNKSVLDGITSTKVSRWDSAYENIGKASYDASGKALATQQWVGNQGFITSSAISDMATKTWVGQQNYITETALSGYATQQWVTNKGYTTLNAVAAYIADEGYATQAWVGQQGYLTGVSVSSNDATISSDLTTIATVQGTAIKAKIASYLLSSEFTASNIKTTLGTTAVNRATADASGNTITSSYLRKDTDDTMAANLAIGAQTSTSTAKKLTIYGRTSSSNPALVIVGVASGTTRYTTNIWRDDTYLQVGSSVYMSGNLVTTGNQTSGNASDRRLKDDIRDIKLDEAEEMLAALHPVTFRWNEKAGELSDGQLTGVSRGFIADELLAQMPGAGRKIWGEYEAIYYEQVIPYLVAGWQKQNLQIRILEGDMRIVRAENESLRRRLRRYEQQ